jgi:hypothetical protein
VTPAALYLGDCRALLRWLPDCSVDAVITDPPYEIGFMGHGWDASGIAFDREVWREVLRVLKPGGHAVAYGAARTYHWLACAVELAGFEIRDMVPWLQGQGMPHGDDISKRIDKDAGAVREVVGLGQKPNGKNALGLMSDDAWTATAGRTPITAPATPEAAQWEGWNTQLAPGHEPAVLAQKPISERTIAANVLRWGVGGLNVGACRLEGEREARFLRRGATTGTRTGGKGRLGTAAPQDVIDGGQGRWPPNVTLSEAAASRLALVGRLQARGNKAPETGSASGRVALGEFGVVTRKNPERGAPSGPSEFFYTPKAATREREQGCEHLRWAKGPGGGFVPWEPGAVLLVDKDGLPIGNPHPTVKPLALMRWLARMVTPPGGLILDPFMGSGTMGVAAVREGFRFLGSDMTPWAHTVARARIRWTQGLGVALEDAPPPVAGSSVQGSLFG